MRLYDMLDEGKISDIAEIKEYFLMLEQKQIEQAFEEGQEDEYQYHINSLPKSYPQQYYNQTYGSDR